MALKPDRDVKITDIASFMNEAAEAGGIASYSTSGSGIAMDQASNLVTYAANASGTKPAGMLVTGMEDINTTRQTPSFYKDLQLKGQKVCLLVEGWMTTNMIVASQTPSAGDTAYMAQSGLITSTFVNNAQTPKIGRFMSRKDEAGYAKVYVDING